MRRKGFEELKGIWDVFEKNHRGLPEFVGNQQWPYVPEAVRRRNQLIHGARVFTLAESKLYAQHTLAAIGALRARIMKEYAVDPWAKQKTRRKS